MRNFISSAKSKLIKKLIRSAIAIVVERPVLGYDKLWDELR